MEKIKNRFVERVVQFVLGRRFEADSEKVKGGACGDTGAKIGN